jgi:hypothetical protein
VTRAVRRSTPSGSSSRSERPASVHHERPFFLGDTAAETFQNIDAVLQVLADASQYPGDSDASSYGTWLILQSLAATAREAALQLEGQNDA